MHLIEEKSFFLKRKLIHLLHSSFCDFASRISFEPLAPYFYHFVRKCTVCQLEIKNTAVSGTIMSWKLQTLRWKCLQTDERSISWVKMGGRCHKWRKDCYESKKQQVTFKFYNVKIVFIQWIANKITWKGKLIHQWVVFGCEREYNVFVFRNTTVFAISNTFSFETQRGKCFKKLLLPNPTKKRKIKHVTTRLPLFNCLADINFPNNIPSKLWKPILFY